MSYNKLERLSKEELIHKVIALESVISHLKSAQKTEGCKRPLAKGQWWGYCGETDMGQTKPALCTSCGGTYRLAGSKNETSNK